jgi:hypothetical protein
LGISIGLWTSLAMLVVVALMIAWALPRPVQPERPTCGAGLRPDPSCARDVTHGRDRRRHRDEMGY